VQPENKGLWFFERKNVEHRSPKLTNLIVGEEYTEHVWSLVFGTESNDMATARNMEYCCQ
jgi:hypothetical protein